MQRRFLLAGMCGVFIGAVTVLAAGRLRASSTGAFQPPANARVSLEGTEANVQETPVDAGGPVHIELSHVNLQLAPSLTLNVRRMRGLLSSTVPGREPVFDDPGSFQISVQSAEVAMSLGTLDALMNQRVFGYPKASLKGLQSRVQDGQLEQKGKLSKGISIPFKVKGELGVTPDGRIRFQAKSMKAFGLPVKPLMKLFSIEMDEMVKVKPGRGVVVEDNDIIIDPAAVLPPPRMTGRVTWAWLEGDMLVQTLGGPEPARDYEPPVSQNHVYFHGGRIRFGKLSMRGADLELIDLDPSDPFEFSVPRYNEQLVAGFSKNTPDHGLKTYMPDVNELRPAGPAPTGAVARASR